jgi:predicted transcriptional regulator
LEAKGYVEHQAEGRAHRFAPLVAPDAARRSALRHLAMKLFGGSAEMLLTHMVMDEKLTDAQMRRIRRLLDQQSRKLKS